MSTNIVYNGVTYTIPATDDVAWGDAVSNFLIAIPSGMLTKVGGSWALTGSDLDLGAAYGLSAIYLKTKTATPALAGVLRLAFADAVAWRASANNKDLVLKPNASNLLTWDAIALMDISTAQTMTNKTINAPDNTITNIKDVNIASDAAIAVSKIDITAASIPWTAVDTVGKIKDADVASDAAIAGSKIDPDFGTQAVKLGGTYKVSLTADPTANYGIEFPKADGTAGQALVKAVGGELEFVSVPGLALNQYHIIVGDSANATADVDTNTAGDIKVDETLGATIKPLVITNAMINAGAAIAFSKLEALPLPLAGGTLTGLLTLDNLGVLLDVSGTTPVTPSTGQIYWDKVNQTAALKLANTDVTLQLGQEMHIYCKNNTAAIIPNGSIVYVSGATTGLPDVSLAKADLSATSDGVIGIATEAIGIGAFGYVTTAGKINDVKTDFDCDSAPLTIGDVLYLSPTVAGGYTKTVSLTPAHQVKVGSVLKVGATDGVILCRIEIGQHMAELHDVLFASLANRDILEYDSTATVWKNYVNPSIVVKEPTGFDSFSKMVLTWNESTARNLTITNPLGTYSYWISGVNYVIAQSSTKTKQVTDTEGVWYFYFDSNKALQAVQGFTNALLNTYAICFAAYWDSTNKLWIMRGEERHGITMDWATHAYLHKSRGAVYYSGGALTTSANVAATVLANTPTAASNDLVDTQMGFDTLTMFDEDIELVLSPLTRITNPIRKLYRLGVNGDWRVHAPGGLTIEPTIAAFGNADTGAAGACYINSVSGGAWQLTAVSNNDYFNTYAFGTNDMTAANQFVLIPGQAVSSTLAGAQALSVSNLALGSLPSPEMIAIYKFTWQYKDASRGSGPADNPVGVILQRVEDLRLAKVTGSSTTAAGVHNSLAGRSTDTAHPASAITNTPSGNLAATDQQGVNNELQSDIDTRATVTGIETLTNKTLQESIVDNFLTYNHENAPAAAAAGTIRTFAKSDNSLYIMDPNGIETQVGSGSGQGEKNYITNGSMKSATTGWATSDAAKLTVTRTTTASELPREYTTATGIKILSVASADSTNAYIYYDFSLDDVDLNKKLKITWAQKMTGTYASGDLAVVITTQADRTTALHTPVTTLIPNVDGVFTTSFDAGSTATLSLVIRATTDMATDGGLVISDVVVGPGSIVTGAAVEGWKSCTVTGGWSTNTTYVANYRRVGDTAQFKVSVALSGAPTSANLSINLPAGMTIDTSKLVSEDNPPLGTVNIRDVGTASYFGTVIYGSASAVFIKYLDDTAVGEQIIQVTQAAPFTFANGDYIHAEFTVPIAEWAGSGTVNLGEVQNAAKRTKQLDIYSAISISGATTPSGRTISSGSGSAIFYSDSTGKWRAKGNISIVLSNTVTNVGFAISGVTFKSTINQAVEQIALDGRAYIYGAGNNIQVDMIAAQSSVVLSFDVDLNAEPTTYTTMANMETNTWQPVGFGAATATSAGLVDTTTQSFAGVKTFTSGVLLPNLGIVGGTYHNYDVSTISIVNTVTSTSTFTGFAGGVAGKVIYILIASGTVTLSNNSASSSAANRIITLTGADLTRTYGGFTLVYDFYNGRWVQVG